MQYLKAATVLFAKMTAFIIQLNITLVLIRCDNITPADIMLGIPVL